MNRTTLLIPARSGNQDEITILTALEQASHRDFVRLKQENIPLTQRKKRQAFFN